MVYLFGTHSSIIKMSSITICFPFIQGNAEGNRVKRYLHETCVQEKKGGLARNTAPEQIVKGVTARKDNLNQRLIKQKLIKLLQLLPLFKRNVRKEIIVKD